MIIFEKNSFSCDRFSLGRYDGDVYQMTDWQIMVHVIQGRDFTGLDINPYVCVQIDDQKRYTGVHRCSNSPFFGEVSQEYFIVLKLCYCFSFLHSTFLYRPHR